MRESFTTSDGRSLAYERTGSGPVLVCHPGGPGASGRYFGDVGGLDRHVTLVRLDPRGTGGSDPPVDGSYRLDDYAADLEELRHHLDLERMSVLGHSHGGFVGIVYAASYPDSIDRLVLVDTLARFSDEQRAESRVLLAAKANVPEFADAAEARQARESSRDLGDSELRSLFARELPLYFVRYGRREREQVALVLEDPPQTEALLFFNREIAPTFDLRSRLGEIVAPTLVIAGEHDYVARPLCAREIAAGIAGARTVIVEDAGHFVWTDQPELVRGELRDFLGGGAGG